MTWSTRFRIRESLRGSLWVVPLLGAVLGGVLGALDAQVDEWIDVPSIWHYSPSTATSVLSAIVGAAAALTGFVVTVTVLAVQMATGTFSARYMRLWYRDRLLKATLAVLVGTLTFALTLLRRIESDFVPDLGVTLAGLLVSASLLLFILFFDRFIHRLRPVAVAALVADAGRQAFDEFIAVVDRPDIRSEPHVSQANPGLLVRAPCAGAIQAVDADGLVEWAREHDAELVLTRSVGDFASTGATVIEVYGGAAAGSAAERELQGMIALGDERTIKQDPAFAIRIMVDVAIRALSPAVNDPTTAVQVIDYLGETLRLIGSTDLAGRERRVAREQPASVVIRSRRWEDYLALAVTEIREYGGPSIQVVRRLRAMLEELRATVVPAHRAAVEDELARLDATVADKWARSVDHDRAGAADSQGIGGPSAA